jgi:hypothetical protein
MFGEEIFDLVPTIGRQNIDLCQISHL